ncbi:UbiD family decarboxylase [Metarhizium rileyi]|uniref:UbiD family decarboxylase n=1 Tax=Metarhizium rileyi (strain RCEF 4871) TaxID=1649241 RepID=A0A167C248_METRR|nr:UbiD family decarboxylase [Metarhizium rileyi RCEF 4871]
MNIISNTNSNLIDPNHPAILSPPDIRQREFGSKMVLLAEQMQCVSVWLVKACLLLMYHRLTLSLKGNLAVKIVACYVAFGFLLMETLYLAVWCRPFNQYWAVPPVSIQCSAATNHLITNAVLNISSDIMILLIPMPVFLQSRLKLSKKLILMGVFALGGFTILSAILNKFYSFNEPFGSAWTFWYIRESSTAIIVANLPLTWTAFRRVFHLRSFNSSENSSKSRSAKPGSTIRSRGPPAHGHTQQCSRIRHDDADDIDLTGSQENMTKECGISLKIYQRHDVLVRSEPAVSSYGRQSSDSLPDGLTTIVQGGEPRSFLHDPDTASVISQTFV